MEPQVIILGRPYIHTLGVVKKQKTTVRGKTYYRYVLTLPRPVLEELISPKDEAPVLAYVARASHLNLLFWEEEDDLWVGLPLEARTELYYQGRAPEKPKSRIVFIAAEEDEIRSLGLNPEKPITLKDVVKAIEEKLATAQVTSG